MMTKKFNLNLFKRGAKAQTRNGNPAKFKGISVRNELMVMLTLYGFREEIVKYKINGKKYTNTDTWYDLEMVDEYCSEE